MVRYSFVLGLALGLGAIGAYVFTTVILTDYRVSGNVIDDSNNAPVQGALVSVPGDSSQEVRQDGSYLFTLPRSRFSDGYTLNVSDDAYLPYSVQIVRNLTDPLTIKLKRRPQEAPIFEGFVNLNVGHWIGRPAIQLVFSLNNQNDGAVAVQAIKGSIAGPNLRGQAFTAMRILETLPAQAGPVLYLHKGNTVRITGSFFEQNDDFLRLSARVNQWIASHPSSLDPMLQIDRLEPTLVTDLQSTANNEFFWTKGDWVLTLSFQCADALRKYTFSFALTDDQIVRMKSNIADYRYGFGVLDALLFAGTGIDRGVVHIDNPKALAVTD
ncbi:hypothetical protein CPY51_29925 [Rhizobium tubonense]|uniref:Carboxypeptidase regulatory-like domain-containing protein n=2 Tax=Rhizobium tubonense TaxID=484088 RepID=A0A2W4E6B9_9HYPH|nr:hypothetical protein CPY51_29925 [Rhizobium tubonense]